MKTIRLSFLLILFFSCVAQAELYKWVGADGKVNYSDIPPPQSVAKVETKTISGTDRSVALPYELAQAVKNMPVTLYSTDKCVPCSEGRNFLKKNGIPFTEKTVSTNEDNDKLMQISGSTQIPILIVGKNKLVGFSSSDWRTNLTQAGYPETNLLPTNYSFSVPQPLAPVANTPRFVEAQVDAKNSIKSKSGVPERDPNGFRF